MKPMEQLMNEMFYEDYKWTETTIQECLEGMRSTTGLNVLHTETLK